MSTNADEELVDYVARHSPRAEADADTVERLLEEAPPVEAAEQIENMVDGFRGGGGAATGKRSVPVEEPPPGIGASPPSTAPDAELAPER